MTPEQLQGWLQLGIGGLMLAALFLGYRRLWVFGWLYDDVVKQRDEWKTMAIHGLQAALEVAQASKQHTTFTPEQADLAERLVSDSKAARGADR